MRDFVEAGGLLAAAGASLRCVGGGVREIELLGRLLFDLLRNIMERC
jgi:hypothetical protein